MSVRTRARHGVLTACLISAVLGGGCAGGAAFGPSRVEAGLAPRPATGIASERRGVGAAVGEEDQRRTSARRGKSLTHDTSGGLAAHGLDHVYFASGRSDLTPETRDMLLGQLHWLKAHPRSAISIEGHADEPGTRDDNIALGSRRATTVRDFLLQRGIRERRILRVVSFGRERPAVRCIDVRCQARNRRVQTVLAQNSGLVSGSGSALASSSGPGSKTGRGESGSVRSAPAR